MTRDESILQAVRLVQEAEAVHKAADARRGAAYEAYMRASREAEAAETRKFEEWTALGTLLAQLADGGTP